MVYRFTFVSDEADDFVRIIDMKSDATFLDLHKAILESVQYNEEQMTSFFICNDNWEKEQEVTLIEMDSTSEYDNLVMESTALEELLYDEKQKMLYVFDIMFERAFFGELTEIISKKNISDPICVKSEGTIPEQMKNADDLNALSKGIILDESFYGDAEFNLDELAEDGYSDMSFEENSVL